MIPTMLAVGLLGGLVGYRRLVALSVVIGAIAVLWAVGSTVAGAGTMGVAATAFGGFALALVNLVIGALVGLGIRSLVTPGQRALRKPGHSAS